MFANAFGNALVRRRRRLVLKPPRTKPRTLPSTLPRAPIGHRHAVSRPRVGKGSSAAPPRGPARASARTAQLTKRPAPMAIAEDVEGAAVVLGDAASVADANEGDTGLLECVVDGLLSLNLDSARSLVEHGKDGPSINAVTT